MSPPSLSTSTAKLANTASGSQAENGMTSSDIVLANALVGETTISLVLEVRVTRLAITDGEVTSALLNDVLTTQLPRVSLEEYEKALQSTKRGYKIVQQRDLTEIYINPYNIEWMRAWNANMDIQVCLDYHAVITYITDYYAKEDSGLIDLINSVLTQEASEDTKERMKTVANTFMTHRQIGEAEAIYRLLPNMTLKNSNIGCQWLAVGKRSETSRR